MSAPDATIFEEQNGQCSANINMQLRESEFSFRNKETPSIQP